MNDHCLIGTENVLFLHSERRLVGTDKWRDPADSGTRSDNTNIVCENTTGMLSFFGGSPVSFL